MMCVKNKKINSTKKNNKQNKLLQIFRSLIVIKDWKIQLLLFIKEHLTIETIRKYSGD